MFTGWFAMAEACAFCGLRYERAQGYWVGAIYVNYGITTLIALKSNAPFTPVKWLKDFAWLGLAYVTGASIAGLLYLSFREFGLPVLLVSVPVIVMFMSTLHSYFQRKEDDQRHMEELKESESRFHSAFTHAAIGMALVSSEGKFIQANRSFCEMLGRTAPDLLTTNLNTLINNEDQNALQTLGLAWGTLGDKTVKIFDAKPLPAKDPKGIAGKLGEIVAVEADGITVVCADGRFKVTRVQPDGGKKIEAAEWAKSANIQKGAILT